jgi:hypothetical protein
VLIRVTRLGRPAFQLRPGEQGISVFDEYGVDPPLTEIEVLESPAFRGGNEVIQVSAETITAVGLTVVEVPGVLPLSDRLSRAHREIRPAAGMTRGEFKQQLRRLEPDGD